jgi:hypothetical protein
VLNAGDRIDFGVGYGTNGFSFDSTGIQATLTSAPQLSIQVVSAGQNRLSWSTNCTSFSLEAAANLPPTLWIPVTNSATIQGQQFTVTVDTTLPGAFYRLSNTH